MPTKKSHDKAHDPAQTANDNIPVDTALEGNAPGDYQGMPDMEVQYVETTETVIPVTQDAREMYIESMKANLEERGVDINALMSRAEGVEATGRSQYLQQLAHLEELQSRASQMLQTLTDGGESAWSTMTESLDGAYESLRSALDAATARFRSEK